MTKILFLINTFSVGGVENHLLSICRNLDKESFDIHVGFFREEAASAESLLPQFNEIEKIHVHDFSINSFFNFFAILRLFLFIRKNRFDVIQTMLFRADLLGILFGKMNQVPNVIASIHDASIFAHHRPKMFFTISHFIMNYVYCFADSIYVISSNIKKYFISTFPKVDINKLVLIYYGSEVPKVTTSPSTLRADLGFREDDVVLGSIGRIDKNKGQDILVEAFISAHKRNNRLRLFIAGHDDYGLASELSATIQRSGLTDQIKFLGFRSDIGDLFASMDIFVIPSLNEGLGLVVIEAMLSGKPVIASNSGALPELVRPRHGLLFSKASPLDLSEKIISLASDSLRRDKMSSNAARFSSSRFSIDSMIYKLSRLYNL